MTAPNLLSQFSSTHEMLTQLLRSVPEADCYRSFHPKLAPLAWYLGYSVYQETYWLREVILGDDNLTGRVRELFSPPPPATVDQWSRLPPLDHLLNWALEIQDDNLTLLATPRLLPPDHPLLQEDRLQHHLLQIHHRIFELMLTVLSERQLQHSRSDGYRPASPLRGVLPSPESIGIAQGHYRIGAKENPAACDNELPPQMVELSGFRIARCPISNGEYLRFLEEGGYTERGLWSDAGWDWLQTSAGHPHRWRRDHTGAWYGIGLNGPFDLVPGAPLQGVSQFEASAFAAWTASLGGELQGAVLQHEYQWEVAVRTQALSEFGQVWEWCSNPFHLYTGFQPSSDGLGTTGRFEPEQITLRGGSIHTQPSLRRPSFRNHALPGSNYLFSGSRLVFPPN